mmetsp:Transcript_26522/g.67936  ORF Transcript_26522/g.67936 Transcript_26522/m.67936 type:complete len:421 (-) Transcript_26522:1114-2376(-)
MNFPAATGVGPTRAGVSRYPLDSVPWREDTPKRPFLSWIKRQTRKGRKGGSRTKDLHPILTGAPRGSSVCTRRPGTKGSCLCRSSVPGHIRDGGGTPTWNARRCPPRHCAAHHPPGHPPHARRLRGLHTWFQRYRVDSARPSRWEGEDFPPASCISCSRGVEQARDRSRDSGWPGREASLYLFPCCTPRFHLLLVPVTNVHTPNTCIGRPHRERYPCRISGQCLPQRLVGVERRPGVHSSRQPREECAFDSLLGCPVSQRPRLLPHGEGRERHPDVRSGRLPPAGTRPRQIPLRSPHRGKQGRKPNVCVLRTQRTTREIVRQAATRWDPHREITNVPQRLRGHGQSRRGWERETNCPHSRALCAPTKCLQGPCFPWMPPCTARSFHLRTLCLDLPRASATTPPSPCVGARTLSTEEEWGS